jgi:hypothetical protein
MDQVTQQNAALVEESAAAAESLRVQAQQLVQIVSVFKLARDEAAAPIQGRAASPANPGTQARGGLERRGPSRAHNVTRPAFGKARPAPVGEQAPSEPMAVAMAARTGTDDWASF